MISALIVNKHIEVLSLPATDLSKELHDETAIERQGTENGQTRPLQDYRRIEMMQDIAVSAAHIQKGTHRQTTCVTQGYQGAKLNS